MSQGFLGSHGQTLVDALFHEREQELRVAFRERMEKMDRREQLAKICGVHDETLLDHLLEMDLSPETVAAIAIVPLVIVAWADGSVQKKEREAIMQAAQESGVPTKDGSYPVLAFWLTEKPDPELLNAWKHYITAMCRQLNETEIDELKHDLLDRANTVAQAAGRLLGLGSKVTAKERAALDDLEAAFG
ncbi:MAG: hypothetical protein ACC628_20475 [Pirellulaceae bacterium]